MIWHRDDLQYTVTVNTVWRRGKKKKNPSQKEQLNEAINDFGAFIDDDQTTVVRLVLFR
jgi:hypothetical protein